jgi:hypothetical protein
LTSETSRQARELVAQRLPEARGLGQALAELIDDPESFVAVLRDGLQALSDEAYAAEQERVAPGSGAVIGVRWPLIHAVESQLRRSLAESSAASAVRAPLPRYSGGARAPCSIGRTSVAFRLSGTSR